MAAKEFDNHTTRGRLQRTEELAVRLGVTPNQIALAYLLNQPFQVIPILGTTDPQHLADAVQATAVRLTTEQIAWLRAG